MDTDSLYDLILEKCHLNPFTHLQGGQQIISFLEETQLELRFSEIDKIIKDKVNLPLYKDVFYDGI